jgi:hypothetical protein
MVEQYRFADYHVPPRHGEGDRREAVVEGQPQAGQPVELPLHLRLAPLPVPGRNGDELYRRD